MYISLTQLKPKGILSYFRFWVLAIPSFRQAQIAKGSLSVTAKRMNGSQCTITSWESREVMLEFIAVALTWKPWRRSTKLLRAEPMDLKQSSCQHGLRRWLYWKKRGRIIKNNLLYYANGLVSSHPHSSRDDSTLCCDWSLSFTCEEGCIKDLSTASWTTPFLQKDFIVLNVMFWYFHSMPANASMRESISLGLHVAFLDEQWKIKGTKSKGIFSFQHFVQGLVLRIRFAR